MTSNSLFPCAFLPVKIYTYISRHHCKKYKKKWVWWTAFRWNEKISIKANLTINSLQDNAFSESHALAHLGPPSRLTLSRLLQLFSICISILCSHNGSRFLFYFDFKFSVTVFFNLNGKRLGWHWKSDVRYLCTLNTMLYFLL